MPYYLIRGLFPQVYTTNELVTRHPDAPAVHHQLELLIAGGHFNLWAETTSISAELGRIASPELQKLRVSALPPEELAALYDKASKTASWYLLGLSTAIPSGTPAGMRFGFIFGFDQKKPPPPTAATPEVRYDLLHCAIVKDTSVPPVTVPRKGIPKK